MDPSNWGKTPSLSSTSQPNMRHAYIRRFWSSTATSEGPLCNCMRDLTPLQSSTATFEGSLPVQLQENLEQRNTSRAYSCRSELENGVLLGTPSLPPDGWLPCRTVGAMSPNQWQIARTSSSSVCPRPHSSHYKTLRMWSLSLSSTGLEQE